MEMDNTNLKLLFLSMLALYIKGQRESGDNFCPLTWFRIYDRCHKFGNATLDFHSARRKCLKIGGDLAAITDEGLLTNLQQRMQQPFNISRPQYRTGLQRHLMPTNEFTWTDGTPSDFFLENYELQGYGSAVWMDEEEFGIAEVNETKSFICQRKMLTIRKEYCSKGICMRLHHQGANHSGESSREECRKKGSDIPFEGAGNRVWKVLRSLLSMYGMDKPVWTEGQDGQYQCWTSISNKTSCPKNNGKTVCVTDSYGKFIEPQCPCEWDEWNFKCHFVTGLRITSRNFAAAVDFCRMNTSEIAKIDTLEDFNYFRRNFPKLDGPRTYWIRRGNFAPTIPSPPNGKNFSEEKCLVLSLEYKKGQVLDANIEERDCSESHQFICRKDVQTDFLKSVCEEGTFTQTCYHRRLITVPSEGVSCEQGQPLTLTKLHVKKLNTKGTPVNSELLWNLTASTGCLAHWIKDGNRYLRFRPQRGYTLFYITQRYESTENLPFICITEHMLLTTQLGIAVGVLLLALTAVSGVWWFICHHRKQEQIYSEAIDHKPVLPARNHPSNYNTTLFSMNAGFQFHQNDAYEPLPEPNIQLHM